MKATRKVNILTLGCKVNQYESEAMKALFIKNGDAIVDGAADVYVINTCTVTNVGDRKSRQMIRRVRRENPDAIVAVVGCLAQTKPEQVAAIEGVNLILGTDKRAKIVEYVDGLTAFDQTEQVGDIMAVKEFERLQIDQIDGKTRVFLKVQEGCNQYCSYCIIPYARGKVRSRAAQDVYAEVERLTARGYVEFVLTGIHLASYGVDLEAIALIDLIESIAKIAGVKRIRLGSLEPTIVDRTLLDRLAKIDSFCPQFHLSLQSGCDNTLKRMNRKYRTADFERAVQLIRQQYPQAAITTDIIVGFPGETDADFADCYQFVKMIDFAELHVFKYSPRAGTPAAKMKGQIDGKVKSQRSEKLIALGAAMTDRYLMGFIGQTLDVLVERVSASGAASGMTIYHTPVALAATAADQKKIVKCQIVDCQNGILRGRMV